ncbi:MAG TPA: hypothetical protein VMV50_03165 [Candidatus Paceibacterota bacterium]|nr:hypothetical protein [Candidatus Paceibacterota bacterium]
MNKLSLAGPDLRTLALSVISFLAAAPVAFAQVPANTTNTGAGSVNLVWLQYYRDTIVWVINSVIVPVLIAVAFIVFLYGVYKYFIQGAASDTERETGRKFVMWGVIGMVIIVSFWGVVNIVKDTLIPSTANNTAPAYPTLPTQ